jgi:hypothetical protein
MRILPRFRSGGTQLRRGAGVLAVATLAAAAALLGLGSTPASAAASGFTVRVAPLSNPLLTVEVQGASHDWGAKIDQWTLNGGANQVWTFVPVSGGFEIVNKNSSQCMTTDGVAGDAVYQFPCVGADTQVWWTGITPGNTVAYSIQSATGSHLYLDVSGGSPWQGALIDTWYWNGGSNQYFLATSA